MSDDALGDLLSRLERNKSERQTRQRLLDELRQFNAGPTMPEVPFSSTESGTACEVERPDVEQDLANVLARRRVAAAPADLIRRLELSDEEASKDPAAAVEDDSEHEDLLWENDGHINANENSWRNKFAGPIPDFDRQVELAKSIEAGVFAEAALDGQFPIATHVPNSHLRAVADNGRKAFEEFLTGNLRLVVHWAFRSAPHLDVQDKFQYGVFGLSRAIERWDWTRGYTFATYASPHIRQAIARGIDNDAYAIRLPVHVQDKLRYGNAEDAPDPEVGESLVVQRARAISDGIYSLDELADELINESDELDARCSDPATWLDDRIVNEHLVARALSSLNDRELRIILRRVGFHDHPVTLEDIGRSEKVTRERIRQIESDVEHRLRSALWADYATLDSDRAVFVAAERLDPHAVSVLMSAPTVRRLEALSRSSGIDLETLSSTIRQIKEAAR